MLGGQVLKAVDETNLEDLVLVLTTEGSLEKAELLAATLLGKGLVACVSLMPIVSHYLWQGSTTRSEEIQVVLKTHPAHLERLYQTVLELHSYEIPEWITLRAQTRGAYGTWCFEQLAAMEGDGRPNPSGRHGDGGPAG